MSDQISLMDIGIPTSDEERLFHSLKPCFLSVMERNGIPEESLTIVPMKSYYSVIIRDTYLVCRIRCSKQLRYISFRQLQPEQSDLIKPFCVSQTKSEKDSGFIRVNLSDSVSSSALEALMSTVMTNTVNSIPKVFDCCSRYMDCSNAKRCVHPNPDFALDCGYRRILNSGRVFYGENRNID